MIDFDRGVLAGTRSIFLAAWALMGDALINFMIDTITRRASKSGGHQLSKIKDSLFGTGQLPQSLKKISITYS